MLSAYDFSLMVQVQEISRVSRNHEMQYGFATPLRLTEKPNTIIAFA